jgi:hypothetical protein
MMANIGSLTADLRLESAAFIRDLKRAADATARSTAAMQNNMTQMQRGFAAASRSIKGLAAAYISLAGVRRVAAFTKQALQSASAIREQAEALGLTAEQFQAYQIAAEQTGGSAEGVTRQIGFFIKSLGQAQQGIGGLAKALMESNPGLLAQLQGATSAREALDLMFNAIREAPTIFEKSRLAALAFGKDAKTAVSLATNSSEEARQKFIDLGLAIKNDAAAKVDDIMDRVDLMRRAFVSGFTTSFIDRFTGALSGSDEQLRTLSETGKTLGDALARAINGAVEAFEYLHHHADEVKAVIVSIVAIKLQLWAITSAGAMVALARSMEEAALAAFELKGGILGLSRLMPIIAVVASLSEESQKLVEESEKTKRALEAQGHAAVESGGFFSWLTEKINALTGGSNEAAEANKKGADAITNVGTQADAATQRIFAYISALNQIPAAKTTEITVNFPKPVEPLTEGATSVGALFGIPKVAEIPFSAPKPDAGKGPRADVAAAREAAEAANEAREAVAAWNDEVRVGMDIAQQTQGPYQNYIDQVALLEKHLAQGTITAGEFGIAQRQAAATAIQPWLQVAGTVGDALGTLFGENKAVAIAQAIINTAQGITAALAQGGMFGWAQAAAIAAAGAAQIATIAKTKPGNSGAPKVGRGGGGKGRGGAEQEAGESTSAGGLQQSIVLQIKGDIFGPDHFRKIVEGINGVQRDGTAVIRMA